MVVAAFFAGDEPGIFLGNDGDKCVIADLRFASRGAGGKQSGDGCRMGYRGGGDVLFLAAVGRFGSCRLEWSGDIFVFCPGINESA